MKAWMVVPWIKRAAALVAAAVDVEAVLCRRVWQELVDSFYWWHVGRAKSQSWANALYFSALGGPKTCVPQIALQAQICM